MAAIAAAPAWGAAFAFASAMAGAAPWLALGQAGRSLVLGRVIDRGLDLRPDIVVMVDRLVD